MHDTQLGKMRLTPFEKSALNSALEGVDGVVYLFGSRTNPSKRGGDIDLLILSDTSSSYKLAQDVTVKFQMQCDEKIDVLVADLAKCAVGEHEFIDSIMREAVLYEH